MDINYPPIAILLTRPSTPKWHTRSSLMRVTTAPITSQDRYMQLVLVWFEPITPSVSWPGIYSSPQLNNRSLDA